MSLIGLNEREHHNSKIKKLNNLSSCSFSNLTFYTNLIKPNTNFTVITELNVSTFGFSNERKGAKKGR